MIHLFIGFFIWLLIFVICGSGTVWLETQRDKAYVRGVNAMAEAAEAAVRFYRPSGPSQTISVLEEIGKSIREAHGVTLMPYRRVLRPEDLAKVQQLAGAWQPSTQPPK